MTTLRDYQITTRRLLNDQTFARVNNFDLIDYINFARGQVATDGECIRVLGTGNVAAGVAPIALSTLALSQAPAGAGEPLVPRNAFINGARVDIRPWDYFANYYLTDTPFAPMIATPVMAQFGVGSTAVLYFNTPAAGVLVVDLAILPVDLVDDATPEAVPYPFTDAVPFYAAWYGYMAQERIDQAERMMLRYNLLMHRARAGTTSTALPENDPGGVGALVAGTKMTLGTIPQPQTRTPQGNV
jgi:hypothetical protein